MQKPIKNPIGIFFDVTKAYYLINHGFLLFKKNQDSDVGKVTGPWA
jgi:hypothetical protein